MERPQNESALIMEAHDKSPSTATNRRSRRLGVVTMIVAGWLASGTVSAADDEEGGATSLFDSKYTLALGGFFPRTRSSFSLGSSRGSGANISLEDDLGLEESSSSAWASFNWRFRPRHTLHIEWFQLNREGTNVAERSFSVGQTVVGVGASLYSDMKFELGRVTYGYSIVRDENLDLSLLVGTHIATVKAEIIASGNITVNGVPVFDESHPESTSTRTFPLPHIGGAANMKFTPKLSGNLTFLAFALDLGDYSGSLIEMNAALAYQITRHFGIGGGLKYFNLNLQANTSRGGRAEFDYTFFGPAIFGYVSL